MSCGKDRCAPASGPPGMGALRAPAPLRRHNTTVPDGKRYGAPSRINFIRPDTRTLIRTKFTLPPLNAHWVNRARLMERLNAGLHHPLLLPLRLLDSVSPPFSRNGCGLFPIRSRGLRSTNTTTRFTRLWRTWSPLYNTPCPASALRPRNCLIPPSRCRQPSSVRRSSTIFKSFLSQSFSVSTTIMSSQMTQFMRWSMTS